MRKSLLCAPKSPKSIRAGVKRLAWGLLACTALGGHCRAGEDRPPPSPLTAYHTRLPFDDHGSTGRYADIVIDLPGKGRFVFSREFSYQPCWEPAGGGRHPVPRLIPRKGDGPDERPDRHNICSHASIVERAGDHVTVHWRYAPDLTKPSFVDYLSAYNDVGNPSPFYADYADEYFTVHADGKVFRTVRNGCVKFAEWTDPANRIEQILQLVPEGIRATSRNLAKQPKATEPPVAGSPVKAGLTGNLLLHWPFDEGTGESTGEKVSQRMVPVNGAHAHWRKGVSGTCLSFDSYSNSVVLPAVSCPLAKGMISVSAWIAPQEFPFNLAAIVDHLDGNRGYFLGMNSQGRIVLRVGNGTAVQELVTDTLPLHRWTHVAAVCGHALVIYLDGEPVTADEPVKGRFADAPDHDLSIGMTRSFRQHPHLAERPCTRRFQSNMVFSGLIDEVKIFNGNLFHRDVRAEHEALKPADPKPLKPWVLPAGPETSPGFGAQYTKLNYSPEWDGLWRVGEHNDIVVTFDDRPWRYVFWRGTRYLPSLVTGHGPEAVWSNDQGAEDYYQGQCHEHMSDMLCRFSHARIIHNTEARTVIHWRNSTVSIDYKWPAVDKDGRGIWSDEYWTIYPDGISIRHQLVRNNTGKGITGELNQNEILHQPGQTTEDVLHDAAVIIASTEGETETMYRSTPQRRNLPANWNLQYLNLNSDTKQFQIGEIGSRSHTILHSDAYWRGWNHYPVQLIPSDGTRIHAYDRPASTCPATFYELQHKDGENIEAMVMYGLTNKKPEELASLNRSWNFAPEVVDVAGARYLGYRKQERAFQFLCRDKPLKFTIRASKEHPLENPAFVIANWEESDDRIALKWNHRERTRGADYKAGIEIDTNGKPVLVVWMKSSSTEPVTLEIGGRGTVSRT
jgi:hypothetical protein